MYVPQKFSDRFWPSWGKRMLFVHTPKCGGSYVQEAFGRRARRCISVTRPELAGHLTWREYRDRLSAMGLSIEDFATFTVIRNPFDWHLSFFSYVRGDRDGRHSGMPAEYALFQKMDFSAYLAWLDGAADPGRVNQYYLMQISDWLLDEAGAVRIPDILRQESLAEDLRAFGRKHDLLLKRPSRRVNASRRGDYRTAYTDRDIEIVARRHARDLAMFGYRFGD